MDGLLKGVYMKNLTKRQEDVIRMQVHLFAEESRKLKREEQKKIDAYRKPRTFSKLFEDYPLVFIAGVTPTCFILMAVISDIINK